jgi:hypothetical protein
MTVSLSRVWEVATTRRNLLAYAERVVYRGEVEPGVLPVPPEGFRLSVLGAAALADPAQRGELEALGVTPLEAAERWARAESCFALHRGDELVGLAWGASTPTPLAELGRSVGASERWWLLRDLKIAEPLRGQRLSTPLVLFALSEIGKRGGAGAFTLAEPENYPLHQAMRRCGFRHAGRVTYTRVGPATWLRYYGYDDEAERFIGGSGS